MGKPGNYHEWKWILQALEGFSRSIIDRDHLTWNYSIRARRLPSRCWSLAHRQNTLKLRVKPRKLMIIFRRKLRSQVEIDHRSFAPYGSALWHLSLVQFSSVLRSLSFSHSFKSQRQFSEKEKTVNIFDEFSMRSMWSNCVEGESHMAVRLKRLYEIDFVWNFNTSKLFKYKSLATYAFCEDLFTHRNATAYLRNVYKNSAIKTI